jgi:hypothetical protein
MTFKIGMLALDKTSNCSSAQAMAEWPNLLKRANRWTMMEGLPGGQLHSRMEPSTQASGSMASEMALDPKCGQMAPSTRANGKMTRPMGKESWCTQTATSTKDSG